MFEPTGFMNFVTKKSVSKCYLAIHSLLLMAIGAALIGFQIYGMLANVFTNAIYAGYWCGGIFLLFGLLTILFSELNDNFVVIKAIMHSFD